MRSYETLVVVYQTTWCHIPKHCELLKTFFISPRKLPPSFFVGFGSDTIRISAGTSERFYVVLLSFPQGSIGITQRRCLMCQFASTLHSGYFA